MASEIIGMTIDASRYMDRLKKCIDATARSVEDFGRLFFAAYVPNLPRCELSDLYLTECHHCVTGARTLGHLRDLLGDNPDAEEE